MFQDIFRRKIKNERNSCCVFFLIVFFSFHAGQALAQAPDTKTIEDSFKESLMELRKSADQIKNQNYSLEDQNEMLRIRIGEKQKLLEDTESVTEVSERRDQQEIQKLKSAQGLDRLSRKLEYLQAKIDQLKTIQLKLTNKISQKQNEEQALQGEINRLQESMAEKKNELSSLKRGGGDSFWDKKRNLLQLLSESKDRQGALLHQSVVQKNTAENRSSAMTALMNKRQALQKQLNEVNKDLDSLAKREEQLRETNLSLQDNNKKREDLVFIDQKIKNLQAKKEEMENFLVLITQKFAADQLAASQFPEEMKHLQENIVSLKKENQTLEQEIAKLNQQQEELSDKKNKSLWILEEIKKKN